MSAQPEVRWQLRPMAPAHLPQVAAIEQRAYEFPWTEGIFQDCLQAGYSAWVLQDASMVVVGYAFMSMAVGEAHVLNLCVDPAHQRQGLGRHLLQHLIRVARAARMEVLLLEVRKSNGTAIALYESAGFRRLGQRKAYYPAREGREDAWLFGMDLA